MPGLNRRLVGGNIGGFDVDEFGISRTEIAQFLAGPGGVAILFEELPTLMISRPSPAAAVVPAGDPRVGSGSKRYAVHTQLLVWNIR